jgi:hypothetical protein
MRKTVILCIVIVWLSIPVLFSLAESPLYTATAAPIPGTGPLTIEGTVEGIKWTPEVIRKGMPEMSGTLAQERTFPARYEVVLADISVMEVKGGYGLAVDMEKGKATLLLNHSADDLFLKKGMRIRVTGYEEWGDEGGSWSKHVAIEVLR